jgi:hypothetical protein
LPDEYYEPDFGIEVKGKQEEGFFMFSLKNVINVSFFFVGLLDFSDFRNRNTISAGNLNLIYLI